jgi:hypothetical protein
MPPRQVLHTWAVRESEWKRLITPLLPEGQDWHVQGRRLAYRAPVGRFLFGVLAEGSAAKGRRHIWRLTMPLFEPSDVLDLSYSERISTVSVEHQTALAEAVGSAIKTLPSEEAEMARLAELTPGPNIRLGETAAYANTYLGKIDRAVAILEAARATADDHEWVGEIKERLQRFERLLRDDGQAGAVQHLDAQAADTATALNLVYA